MAVSFHVIKEIGIKTYSFYPYPITSHVMFDHNLPHARMIRARVRADGISPQFEAFLPPAAWLQPGPTRWPHTLHFGIILHSATNCINTQHISHFPVL